MRLFLKGRKKGMAQATKTLDSMYLEIRESSF